MTRPISQSQNFPTLPGYVLTEQIYTSSKTLVYRGAQLNSQRPVVIKLLRPVYPSFNELVRFRNQYAILKNLNLPGIVRPLSLEPWQNSYALVMEDSSSISLALYMQQHPLSLAEALNIGIQLAEILHHLHSNRIIHKGIKPANLLIDSATQKIQLIDFSIASLLPKEIGESKPPNRLEGTLAYMAPEQTGRLNRAIDYRTDFYSLGITLYQLLTGELPFPKEDPLELIHCHITQQPTALENWRKIPAVVSEIVMKLMAKNSEDRYQSALGLKFDLENCQTQLNTTGAIASFPLGTRDLSDRFLIPEKLYGREQEVAQLLSAFDRVSQRSGAAELILVAGYSGIGKTAVINEIYKPIVEKKGYFIKGKYDQFNRNIPFFAIRQAFRDLIGQLLAESDIQIAVWRQKILEAVGENGQILIEALPELERIIGSQPSVSELSGIAAQNRFNLLFQKFIALFSAAERPLTLFLDDLQWVDAASLQLIELCVENQDRLLILGAYRDNEVTAEDPLFLTVKKLKKANKTVETITLSPLTFENINQLIADTLHCFPDRAQPLAEFVFQKTQGNPFFATQFLKALSEDGQIVFNESRGYWECDLASIARLSLTENIVKFMAGQLQKLPPETQDLLELAACIGNQFDLTTLAIVAQKPKAHIAANLWKSLQEGLIVPQNEIYKFYLNREAVEVELRQPQNVEYRFLHDRVQQAAYSLISEPQKAATHLQIGRLLLQKTSPDLWQKNIFVLVNQFNYGKELIETDAEKYELVNLSLIAGTKARKSAAYEAAFNYAKLGLQLLADRSWEERYDLTLNLYDLAAETAFLTGEFERMEVYCNLVLERAQSPIDKMNVYTVKIQANMARIEKREAIQLGLEALELLGIHFPPAPTEAEAMQALTATAQKREGRPIDSLALLPVMTDSQQLVTFKMLNSLATCAFQSAPSLCLLAICKMVDLSIEFGNCAFSSYAYACYGAILNAVFQDLESSYQFGQLAIETGNLFNAPDRKAAGWLVAAGTGIHVKAHLKETLPILREVYRCGLEGGNFEYSGYAAAIQSQYSYCLGWELALLETEIIDRIEALVRLKQEGTLQHNQMVRQCVLNLQQPSDYPAFLKGEAYDETQVIPKLKKDNDRTALQIVYLFKSILGYLFGREREALEFVRECEQYLDGVPGYYYVPLFYFYDSLLHLSCYSSLTPSERENLKIRVAGNQEKLQNFAASAPMNFQHKFSLVEAQRQSIFGHQAEALDWYDRAIAGAKQNEYLQEEALANELAAKFYLDWGKEKVAAAYLQEAYYGYARWGALAKTKDLEQRYPKLLQPILERDNQPLKVLETLATLTPSIPSIPATGSQSDSYNFNKAFDFAALLQVSRAISSTLDLDELLSILTQNLIKNSGADKCALILYRDGEWQVQAISNLQQTILQTLPLNGHPDLPYKLIQYAKNTLQSIALDDIETQHPNVSDPYLYQHRPKSVLCLPILNGDNLVGVLYLENRMTRGVFASERLLVLNFLCYQATVAIDNARLYRQVQQMLKDLQTLQLQFVQSEKMSALESLATGVDREIKNPIGCMVGNFSIARDYIDELLKLIDLYCQTFPHPGPAIEEELRAIDLDYVREDICQLIEAMEEGSERIKTIGNSLRTFSMTDSKVKQLFNLHDGLESTLLILRHRLRANEDRPAIEIVRDYGSLPEVHCFPGQLNQVFMNLLVNAIDTLEETNLGRSFDEIAVNPNRITLRTRQNRNRVEIAIADNGISRSDLVRSQLFDPLLQPKNSGKRMSLGLALARAIVVEKHQGELEIRPLLPQGSEAFVSLPLLI